MPERALILIADDSDDDITVIRRALKRASVPNPLFAVKSGEEVIAYLKGEGRYSNRDEYPLPDLLLLDLKMPGIDGFDVLRWIRQQPGLSSMRIVVLTASDHMRDVNLAYQLGANSFMVKPGDFENYVELGKTLATYWLRQSKAPETSRQPKQTQTPKPQADKTEP
jgi:CheY-like chemotaxis protein